MYELKGWAGTILWVLFLYLGNTRFVAESSAFSRAIHLAHSALKHGITAVTTINFSMGSVAIMTYSWSTLSYWPDRQYWFIEETRMLSWQPEVMVGGNRAGDGEGCSLSFELYCCYRFPIRKKDGPLYWPTTSMKVCLNHSGQQRPSSLCNSHQMWYSAVTFLCVCAWLVLLFLCMMIRCKHVFLCTNIHQRWKPIIFWQKAPLWIRKCSFK